MKITAVLAIMLGVIMVATATITATTVDSCDMSSNGGYALQGCWGVNYVVNATHIGYAGNGVTVTNGSVVNMCAFDKKGNNYCKLIQGGLQGYPGLCVPASAVVGVPTTSWFNAGTSNTTFCPRCPPTGTGQGRGIGCGGMGSPACGGGDGCPTCVVTYYGPGSFTSQCS